jgi:hypothetical protein
VRLRTLAKIALVLVLAALVAVLSAVAWFKLAPREVPPGQPPLATLGPGSLSDLRATFDAGAGEIRLLVMLSPT